jgi:hypothetical protein
VRIWSEEGRQHRAGAVPVPTVIVTVLVALDGRDAVSEHPGAQALAEYVALGFGHHHEIQFDLLHPGHGEGSPVNVLRQVVDGRPGGHRQGHFDQDTAPARAHGPEEAEFSERQAQLGLFDGAQRGLKL